jgi:hypothetical protein
MKSVYDIEPVSLERVRTYALAKRKSKVTVREFARPLGKPAIKKGAAGSASAGAGRRAGAAGSAPTRTKLTFREFFNSLPRILAGNDLREIVAAMARAKKRRKPILWGIGGHVIKVGLAPVLIDLLRRGYVSGIAMNGAALVHDFEIALAGNTSEDVEQELGRGEFGMAEETGLYLNEIAVGAARSGIGLGEAAGKLLTNPRLRAKRTEMSVLAAAYRARVPVTVHVAIGTDIPHMHRSADGAALGAATHHDFRIFCALVKRMHPGGVYLNWGSAVLLPEVFLKAVSVTRNLGTPLAGITTANFDFVQHYRPVTNVVRRPTMGKGSRGFAITGHHEVMLPLLAAALP